MKTIIYAAAFVAALLTVLSTRLFIPAAIILFRAIEQSFAPTSDTSDSTPVLSVVADAPAPAKPRATRKRSRTATAAKSSATEAKKVTPKKTVRKPRASVADLKVAEGFA